MFTNQSIFKANRGFLLTLVGFATTINSCHLAKDKHTDEMPNILFIVADDMGVEIGCYGDKVARTPYLDKFASENIRFENAYVTQSSCSPSRSSILTGLYPHQNGQFGLSHRGISMYQEFPNIFSLLKEAGYYTGVLGKLHVKPLEAFPLDFKVGGLDYESPGLEVGEVSVLTTDGDRTSKHVTFSQRIDLMADSAASFFRQAGDRPFFLMANYFDPHEPFYNQIQNYPENPLESGEVQQLPYFRETESMKRIAGYHNGNARFDAGFNMIINKLRESGKFENTMIVFIGDNGAPLSGGKLSCFESGLKVPFIMKLPEKNIYKEISSYVSMIDLFPTIIEICGKPVPENLPGKSLLPLIKNENISWRTYVAGEFNQHQPEYLFPQRSIRKDSIKLIYSYFTNIYHENILMSKKDYSTYDPNDRKAKVRRNMIEYYAQPQLQLYNLNVDPYEFNNLADNQQYSDIKQMMLEILHQWQVETNDPIIDSIMYEEYVGAIIQNIKDAFNDSNEVPARKFKSIVLHE